MKIFGTDYMQLVHLEDAQPLSSLSWLYYRTDNALMNSGKSLYPPDFLGQLYYMLQLTVRIERVGKGIAPQYAHRYYHEAAWSFSLYSPSCLRERRGSGLDPMIAYSFDGALVVGDMQPIHGLSYDTALLHTHQRGSAPECRKAVEQIPSLDMVSAYISELSHLFLLKMGDLVTFPLQQTYAPVPPDGHLMLSIDGDEHLYVHIR